MRPRRSTKELRPPRATSHIWVQMPHLALWIEIKPICSQIWIRRSVLAKMKISIIWLKRTTIRLQLRRVVVLQAPRTTINNFSRSKITEHQTRSPLKLPNTNKTTVQAIYSITNRDSRRETAICREGKLISRKDRQSKNCPAFSWIKS